MQALGPWPPRGAAPSRIAVAVSGGGDSMALALLARGWAPVVALIVDHGIRPDSAEEAALTAARLAALGLRARILRLRGLSLGPGLPARARTARYAALEAACREAGLLHLLLGHQALDQSETQLMRALRGSGPAGRAGMAALVETPFLRLLRPLLGIAPERLRATLRAAGVDWVEDPTNHDVRYLRPRLRARLRDGPVLQDGEEGAFRAAAEDEIAARLAACAEIRPEGFAVLAPGPLKAAALSALVQALAGTEYPPPPRAVAALAAAPRPATLGGVRLMPAGRLGAGLLAVREAAAMAPDVAAAPGALWDRRFRLHDRADPPPAATLGALGAQAASLRGLRPLPAAVLRTLPALRVAGRLFAVPHLGYPDPATCARVAVAFAPRRPASGAPFLPCGGQGRAVPCRI